MHQAFSGAVPYTGSYAGSYAGSSWRSARVHADTVVV